ncbi:MAG: radical SAM protein [bacterium]
MRPENEENALQNLKSRINLLSRGVVLPDESIPAIHMQSARGGSGPQGIACYLGNAPGNHNSQISLVVYPKDHYMANYAIPTKWWKGEEDTSDIRKRVIATDDGIFLEEVGHEWKGISPGDWATIRSLKARMHPYRTYSACLYRSCRHLEKDAGCKFCTTDLTANKFNLPKRQPDQTNLEYLKLAIKNGSIRSVSVTSGTLDTPEKTGTELLALAARIREETGLSVHVQTEPILDPGLMKELSSTVDSIGIFLEFFDEKVRRKICPGKAQAFTQEDYMKSWEMAASCFGRGKVWNINIIGFDEDYDVTLKGIERAARIGVMTSIFLLRVGSPNLGEFIPTYIGREDEVLQLHKEFGKVLVKHGVDNASPENSGCMGCQGCNATKEAINWARAALRLVFND